MRFRFLLYKNKELASEQHLLEWMETEAPACGVTCVDVEGIGEIGEEALAAAIARSGAAPSDCLWIVAGEAEWQLADKHNIAALPYVPPEQESSRGLGGPVPQFPGAWLIMEGFDDIDYDFLNKCYLRAHHLPWEILSTERCLLRELCMDDMDALFALYEQPGVTDYMEGLYARDEETQYEQAYIENMYRYYGYGMWLVCKKETGEIIGRAGLEHRDYHGTAELELGYMIAPSEQRKGYAAEVCRALVEFAAEQLDFPRVNCLIQADNWVSKHLAERLGFTFFEKMDVNGTEMERYIYCFLQENCV